MGMLQAVFLDVGGPIYDDENYVAAVLTALDELRAADGRGAADRATFRLLYDEVRAAQGGSLRSALAGEFLGDRARRAELHERTREHWVHPAGTLYPDVLPFLRSLECRVRVGVLANQEERVVRALERDGVAPFIDVWGVSAIVGFEKPSPELFRWCLEQAGVEASGAVHIGNRLDTDVRPAAALGLATVWLLRGEAAPSPTPEQLSEPDLAVPTLDGLAPELFSLMEARA
ncbi:HAD family hydrolase [Herbiconiux sp. CPCC 203407]|uniref:HAD family hydrolase n=1 Tax=Herbiconiux oxytropis TaxID=2970915 RepID=A0AA41XGU0_9MICO|nr:HAD family hydrolase [Herbiconiux oxytropis]MCS5721009.1 HAD family hydrolase [Herbiconiux oxytropis]MCS5724661.1 HAD family hydrolase [Herbiconiux oxytropis]